MPLLGFLDKKKLGKLAKSIGLGLVDAVPVVGTTLKANIQAEEGGKGKLDYVRLAAAIISVATFIAIVAGKISIEQAEAILNLF